MTQADEPGAAATDLPLPAPSPYGRRILILSPHPDDEVVGCAAAIGRARATGAAVAVLHLTTGVPAREVLWPWRRRGHAAWVARRRAEAERSAALLGVAVAGVLDFPTRTLKDHLAEARDAVVAAIARLGTDTVWVPAYEGGHQDHDAAHCLAGTLAGLLGRAAPPHPQPLSRQGRGVQGGPSVDDPTALDDFAAPERNDLRIQERQPDPLPSRERVVAQRPGEGESDPGPFAIWEFAEYNFAGGTVRSQQFFDPDASEIALTLTPSEAAAKRDALALYASERGNLGHIGVEREGFRPFAARRYARPPHSGKLFWQRFQWVPFRHPRVDFTRPDEVCRALTAFTAQTVSRP